MKKKEERRDEGKGRENEAQEEISRQQERATRESFVVTFKNNI